MYVCKVGMCIRSLGRVRKEKGCKGLYPESKALNDRLGAETFAIGIMFSLIVLNNKFIIL